MDRPRTLRDLLNEYGRTESQVKRDTERDVREGVEAFDREYFARFGRYPDESTLEPPKVDPRRAAIEALIERGATEGERAAARAALYRIDRADELDELPQLRPDLLEQEDEDDDYIPL